MIKRILEYFNTTKESGEVLQQRVEKAKAQRLQILDIFIKNPNKLYTGSMIQSETGYLIVSCRRVITNLAQQGEIIRVGKQVCKDTGSSEYTYCYKGQTKHI